jgi:predicted flap endonuclease-1-like 5' DNA nuclease
VKLEDVEGIGVVYAGRLRESGIATTQDLLLRAGSRSGRGMLAASSGIAEKLLLEWVNHCDLMRIDGVGAEYADLLEAAGIDSCAELSLRNPANLHAALAETNERTELVRRLPSVEMVGRWVAAAGTSDRVVSH